MTKTSCYKIDKDFHSGLRIVEHIKTEMKKIGLIPIVVLLNGDMHIDVFYENVSGKRPETKKFLANMSKMFCDPSIKLRRYRSYKSVISVMEKNETEVFWESMNNWRMKS